MQLLQIDTISVVARSPYLVLYSRLGSYDPRWLDELLAAGKLCEYWAHAACFLPVEDYPLALVRHEHTQLSWQRRWKAWAADHKREVGHVLERIRKEGALRSKDFENETKRGTWWDWKVEKIALEYLLLNGDLMVARREGFQRVYDLRERVLPKWEGNSKLPGAAETYKQLVEKSALALGAATEPWLRDYYRLKQVDTKRAIGALLADGVLTAVELESTGEEAYVHAKHIPLLRKALRGGLDCDRTELLSPFDPIVWHRERASQLFGFDYLIECYTVEHKRQYGYFTLPILHRGALIGRLDPKAHRRQGVFEVKSFHLEPGVKLGLDDWDQLGRAIRRLAEWHGLPGISVGSSSPASSRKLLVKALDRVA